MREGIHNVTLGKIEHMLGKAKTQIDRDLKGVRPFDKEVVSPKQKLLDYSMMTPEDLDFARQQFGNEAMDNYLRDIDKMARRYK